MNESYINKKKIMCAWTNEKWKRAEERAEEKKLKSAAITFHSGLFSFETRMKWVLYVGLYLISVSNRNGSFLDDHVKINLY